MKKYPDFHRVPEYDYEATDELAFGIDDQITGGIRRKRGDGSKGRLEDRLGEFIHVLDEELQAEGERLRHAAEFQKRWQEEARQRQEAEQRRQEEEKRIKELHAMVDAWNQSQRIRAFLSLYLTWPGVTCSAGDRR